MSAISVNVENCPRAPTKTGQNLDRTIFVNWWNGFHGGDKKSYNWLLSSKDYMSYNWLFSTKDYISMIIYPTIDCLAQNSMCHTLSSRD